MAINFQAAAFEKINTRLLQFLIWSILALISIALFSICIIKGFPDVGDHNVMAYGAYHGTTILQVHFLYFIVLMIPQLLSDNMIVVQVFSVLVLTLSVLFKYRVSQRITREQLVMDTTQQQLINTCCVLIPFFVMLAQNLIYKPTATMFLGFLPVNTWHNSTTIFVFPFAVLLFYHSYQYLLKPGLKKAGSVVLLVLLNLCIKPSFLIPFVVVFPFFGLLVFHFTKPFFQTLALAFLSGAGLLIQSKIGSYIGTTVIALRVAPFHVWAHWSSHMLLSFLSSVLFPLLYFLFYFKEIKKDLLFKYSSCLFLFALLVYILITETGAREFDGNFLWQVIICNYVLFLVTAIRFFHQLLVKKAFSVMDKIILISFILHVLTGIIYIFKSPIWSFR